MLFAVGDEYLGFFVTEVLVFSEFVDAHLIDFQVRHGLLRITDGKVRLHALQILRPDAPDFRQLLQIVEVENQRPVFDDVACRSGANAADFHQGRRICNVDIEQLP